MIPVVKAFVDEARFRRDVRLYPDAHQEIANGIEAMQARIDELDALVHQVRDVLRRVRKRVAPGKLLDEEACNLLGELIEEHLSKK